MFQVDLLSNIRSLNTVFTAPGICHTSYVDCLLEKWCISLAFIIRILPDSFCSFGFHYKNKKNTFKEIQQWTIEHDIKMIQRKTAKCEASA